MIEAVLFDFGDTLVTFRNADVYSAFRKAAENTYDFLGNELGLSLPPLKKYYRYQLRSIHWAYFKSKLTRREFNAMDIIQQCLNKMHISLPDDRIKDMARRWYQPLADQTIVEPDALSTLEQLRQRGLKLALVSNTFLPGHLLDEHLEREGMLEYFPHRVYSCDLGVRKPKKAMFAQALEKVDTPVRNAVFVGDTYSADIVGSRRLGMYAILKSADAPTATLDDSTFLIRRLSEIPIVIDRIDEIVERADIERAAG